MQVNILDAKNRLSELVRAAQCGDEVIIANRGQPVVRLVAVAVLATLPVRAEPLHVNAWLAKRPLPRHARRSASEIDATLAHERAAWD